MELILVIILYNPIYPKYFSSQYLKGVMSYFYLLLVYNFLSQHISIQIGCIPTTQ